MAILEQPESGALSTFKAARYAVQVNTGTPGVPVWTWWNGLSKFEPSADPTMQDDTDIFSDGFKSQLVTATSLDVSAEGLIKGLRSGISLPVDPGAAFVRSKQFLVGEENVIQVRYWRTDELDAQAVVQNFAVSYKDVGGSNEDLQKFTADLKGRGKFSLVAKPGATPQVKLISFNSATAITAGTWTLTINGETATGLAFGITSAALKTAIEALTVVAGTVTVTGTVATGFSVTFATDYVNSMSGDGSGLTPTTTILVA